MEPIFGEFVIFEIDLDVDSEFYDKMNELLNVRSVSEIADSAFLRVEITDVGILVVVPFISRVGDGDFMVLQKEGRVNVSCDSPVYDGIQDDLLEFDLEEEIVRVDVLLLKSSE